MRASVTESMERPAQVVGDDEGLMRDPPKRQYDTEPRHFGDGGGEKIAAGFDLGGVGLFSGGTQRTAFVMRQSISSRLSSGRASNLPRAKPNSSKVA